MVYCYCNLKALNILLRNLIRLKLKFQFNSKIKFRVSFSSVAHILRHFPVFLDVMFSFIHKVRSWEKQLQQHLDKDLEKQSEIILENYFGSLPPAGETHKIYADGQSPVDYLEQLCSCFAIAIKNKGKIPEFHLKLGMVLEEIFVLEDVFGIRKLKASTVDFQYSHGFLL